MKPAGRWSARPWWLVEAGPNLWDVHSLLGGASVEYVLGQVALGSDRASAVGEPVGMHGVWFESVAEAGAFVYGVARGRYAGGVVSERCFPFVASKGGGDEVPF